MSSLSPTMESAGPNPKIAIPRRRKRSPEEKGAVQSTKHRLKTACVHCRTRKVRCTGELPRCYNCEKASVGCVYAETRGDRLKDVMEQNRQFITLLRDLSFRVNNGDKKRIDELLNSVGKEASLETLGTLSREPGSGEESLGGEAHISGSVGSNRDVDIIDEDMFRSHDSQATGFVGRNSEVQWLRSLKHQVQRGSNIAALEKPLSRARSAKDKPLAPMSNALRGRQESFLRGNSENVTDSTFYLDRDDLEVDIIVDEDELPPIEVAERLFESYISTIHTSFPILPQDFEGDFKKYINSVKQKQPLQPSRKWRAVLNLTFAIGAKYSHLANAEWQADSRDHLIYMNRALRLLELQNTLVFISTPDLALIQATGLLSMYYLVIGHINRAWVMIGVSLRSALALGLHLRNEDQSTPSKKKEILVRTWWGLHSIETLVSAMTGRPCIIATEDCTVPFPRVQRGEQTSYAPPSQLDVPIRKGSSSDTCLGVSTAPSRRDSIEFYINVSVLEVHIRHRLIIKKAIELLYSPRAAKSSWEQTQKAIASLMDQLEKWAKAAFPKGLTLASFNVSTASTQGLESQREQLLLAFSLFSAQILITRPCLCQLERRIQGQSNNSANFNQKIAETCVQAAQDLSMLLPDIPDPLWIYQSGPWWCIIHNIMQAMTIFLLEISYDGAHTTSTSAHISQSVRKLILWLRSMRHNDAVAERAYQVVFSILKNAPHALSGIADLLLEDEVDPSINQTFQAVKNQFHPASPLNLDWQLPGYINCANPTATSQAQLPKEHHQFVVDDLYSDPYFFSGPSQMPPSYRDLFMTSFDQMHPLAGQSAENILGNSPIFPPATGDL